VTAATDRHPASEPFAAKENVAQSRQKSRANINDGVRQTRIGLQTRIDQMHNQNSALYQQWLTASQSGKLLWGGGFRHIGTAALVPASRCTGSCSATAESSGVTAAQLGGYGSHNVLACFAGDGANDAASSGSTSVSLNRP
jgi:hypothetical protein